MKTKPKTAAIATQADLAKALGITQPRISRMLRDPRWREAGFGARPPWSADEVSRQRKWREDVLQEDRGEADDSELGRAKTAAQIKVLIERKANLRVDRLIKEKEYIKRADFEEQSAEVWRGVRNALEQLPKGLRAVLGDADADGAQRILEEALGAIVKNL